MQPSHISPFPLFSLLHVLLFPSQHALALPLFPKNVWLCFYLGSLPGEISKFLSECGYMLPLPQNKFEIIKDKYYVLTISRYMLKDKLRVIIYS